MKIALLNQNVSTQAIIVQMFTKVNSKYIYYVNIYARGERMEHGYIKRMKDLREDNDLTQVDVARILGTSQTMYARYERGANALPIHHLLTLCDYYKVSADYLLGRTDKK